MANKHLRLEPHKIGDRKDAWWYEEHAGITVVIKPSEITEIVKIPWKAIRNALERKDRQTKGEQ